MELLAKNGFWRVLGGFKKPSVSTSVFIQIHFVTQPHCRQLIGLQFDTNFVMIRSLSPELWWKKWLFYLFHYYYFYYFFSFSLSLMFSATMQHGVLRFSRVIEDHELTCSHAFSSRYSWWFWIKRLILDFNISSISQKITIKMQISIYGCVRLIKSYISFSDIESSTVNRSGFMFR